MDAADEFLDLDDDALASAVKAKGQSGAKATAAKRSLKERMGDAIIKAGDAIEEYVWPPMTAFGNKFNDATTAGAYNYVLDKAGVNSATPEQRAALADEQPFASAMGGVSGSVGVPWGAPAKAAASAGAVANMASSGLAKRAPGLAQRMGWLGGVPAAAGRAAAEGAMTGAQLGASEAATSGQPIIEGATRSAAQGASIGGAFGALSRAGGRVAEAISDAPDATGRGIRFLESYGASPSPVPFRPVRDPRGAIPKDKRGDFGRGQAGAEVAKKMEGEVEAMSRANRQRFDAEKGASLGREGDRIMSVEPAVQQYQTAMEDLSLPEAVKARLRTEIPPKLMPNTGEPPMTPRQYTDASVVPERSSSQAPMSRAVSGRLALPAPETQMSAAPQMSMAEPMSYAPPPPSRSQAGQAPGRGQPINMRTVREADKIRDAMDTLAKMENVASGIKKEQTPFAAVGGALRSSIADTAPKTALANRRFSARQRKLDLTSERIKKANPGAAGEDNRTAGSQAAALDELRAQFPNSDAVSSYDLDVPRLLMEQERMSVLSPPMYLRDVARASEKLKARYAYPFARKAEAVSPQRAVLMLRQLMSGDAGQPTQESEETP